jgi:hypothetical protein
VQQFSGSVEDVAKHIPHFDRRDFSVAGQQGKATAKSDCYDAIVRLPLDDKQQETPVGVVSKSYRLIQHHEVLKMGAEALRSAGIDPDKAKAELRITRLGERMDLCLVLPEEPQYQFAVPTQQGPEDKMGLRFHCLNSVDGSTRLVALLGWLRLVCSNGLIVGTALCHVRKLHTLQLEVGDLALLFSRSLETAQKERPLYERWIRTPIDDPVLRRWVDGPVRKAWGVKVATRAYHIVRTGHDVDLVKPFERALPSRKTVEWRTPVPGSLSLGCNAFSASQALSWLAGQRREIPDQLDWMAQISDLVRELVRMN